MNKKADLSLNIVIIAVIGLIVLIVLAVIFSGKLSMFGKSTSNVSGSYENKCAIAGRECLPAGDCAKANGVKSDGSFSDCVSPSECCMK
jgi:hypothetical protein